VTTLAIVGWLGTVTFAASGALVAGRKKLDLFGTLCIAFVTAFGGGTLRDLLLGVRPVFWVQDPLSVALAIVTGAVTFIMMRFVEFPRRVLVILDAMGLAAFAVLGCDTALEANVPPLIAVLMGMISGAAGGAIRDIATNDIPMIFLRAELYATAAVLGAAVFALLQTVGVQRDPSLLTGAAVAFLVRIVALRWHLQLPEARLRRE
jgi:uncharacterized membrane protein YeiH